MPPSEAHSGDATSGRGGAMSARRRDRIRLDVSREASLLFWRQGVAATTGEQIADAMGLSVRTLWRYFRNKESCVEPMVAQNIELLMAMLRRWPAESSLEDHFAAEFTERGRHSDSRRSADDLLSVQMVKLADTEPAIRSAWLMACDRIEREMAAVFAGRLRGTVNDPQVRLYAAAAGAAVRVVNEDTSRDLLERRYDRVDPRQMSRRLAAAVRTSTGGAVGDSVVAS